MRTYSSTGVRYREAPRSHDLARESAASDRPPPAPATTFLTNQITFKVVNFPTTRAYRQASPKAAGIRVPPPTDYLHFHLMTQLHRNGLCKEHFHDDGAEFEVT